jgi:hypothetical protein
MSTMLRCEVRSVAVPQKTKCTLVDSQSPCCVRRSWIDQEIFSRRYKPFTFCGTCRSTDKKCVTKTGGGAILISHILWEDGEQYLNSKEITRHLPTPSWFTHQLSDLQPEDDALAYPRITISSLSFPIVHSPQT